MKDRFDTGLQFFISFVSSPGFFKSGVTIACLLLGRDYKCRKRGINNKHDTGEGSRDRIKHATFRR